MTTHTLYKEYLKSLRFSQKVVWFHKYRTYDIKRNSSLVILTTIVFINFKFPYRLLVFFLDFIFLLSTGGNIRVYINFEIGYVDRRSLLSSGCTCTTIAYACVTFIAAVYKSVH